MSQSKTAENRWLIAIMGTLLQVCLGTVYAWSFFQKPIMATFGWNNSEVAWIFSLAICFLGLSAAWGGVKLPVFGPRKLAVTGAVLYGTGYILSALVMKISNLPLFYLCFGVLGGIGLGLGYVTPVATCAKWFPDKKGFITGMVVMGFGLGALFMSKIFAPVLMNLFSNNLTSVFFAIGILLIILGATAGVFMRNPPVGFVPAGYTPQTSAAHSQKESRPLTPGECIFSPRFVILWLVFFTNITAGIMFIGFQSPMLQDLLRKANTFGHISDEVALSAALAASGATLIAVSSLFNGLGRFFWGGLSDSIGRIKTFRIILGSQILIFAALVFVPNPIIFGILVCYILLCYGGGFGTAPSTVLTIYGTRLMPIIYGVLLTAWSCGGIVGPQIAAFIKDHYPANAASYTFMSGATVLIIGFILTFFLSDKAFEKKNV